MQKLGGNGEANEFLLIKTKHQQNNKTLVKITCHKITAMKKKTSRVTKKEALKEEKKESCEQQQ